MYLLLLILWFHVDVPFRDEWELVPHLEQLYEGTLSVYDIWKPQNEHRVFFPKIVLLSLAWLSHWNNLYELLLNLAIAVATFLVLVRHTNQVRRCIADGNAAWIPLVFSLLVFSLNQFENWFMGLQLCLFLNVFSVVVGYTLLARALTSWRCFLGAVGCGLLATFSFANGLLYWPIALLMLGLLTIAKGQRHDGQLVLWFLVSVAVSWAYFCDYSAARPSFTLPLGVAPLFLYVSYVLSYLGSPLTIFAVASPFAVPCSAAVGAGGTAAFGFLIWRLGTRDHLALPILVYPVALGCYAIGSGLMIGSGRSELGLAQALSSRYIILSSLLWIANAILLAMLGQVRTQATTLEKKRFTTHESLAGIVVVVMLVLSSVGGTVATVRRAEKRQSGRAELLNPQDAQRLLPLYPDVTVIR